MRVTNSMLVNNLLRNLNRNLVSMEKNQNSMASGKKFTRPSDDPVGVSRSLRLNTEVSTIEQYKRNAGDIQSWFSTTEEVIKNIDDVLKRAKELTIQAASETNSLAERRAIASEISELREQLLQMGNTAYAGSYLFTGYKTDKPLFDASSGKYDIGGNNTFLSIDEIINVNIGMKDKIGLNMLGQRLFGYYSGSGSNGLDTTVNESIKNKQSISGSLLDPATLSVSPGDFTLNYGGADITISLPGPPYTDINTLVSSINTAISGTALDTLVSVSISENRLVFRAGGELIIKPTGSLDLDSLGFSDNQGSVYSVESGDESQLIAVFDQLITDLKADNTKGINDAITRLDKQSANINTLRAEIGVRSNRIELTTNRIENNTLNLKGLLSKNEDADMAEVIMNLLMQQNVYNASLSGGAKIIQPSLVDFLR